jgi:hypothetical protein
MIPMRTTNCACRFSCRTCRQGPRAGGPQARIQMGSRSLRCTTSEAKEVDMEGARRTRPTTRSTMHAERGLQPGPQQLARLHYEQ